MNDYQCIEVNIYGHQYRLKGPQAQDEILKLASELDERMRVISSDAPALATHQVAVLAALRILEELNILKKEYEKGFQLALFNNLHDKE